MHTESRVNANLSTPFTQMLIVMMIVALACGILSDSRPVAAGGLSQPARDPRSCKETTTIGHLAWEITETSTGKVLGTGNRDVKANEVQVLARAEDNYLEQRIPLSDGFFVKLNSGRNKGPYIGFGMTAGKTDEESFSWEWFNVDRPNHAVKLKETGELEFQSEKIGEHWEIVQTRFLSDISMRVIRWSTRTGHEPTWRVKILKDSQIQWPTLAGKKVLLPRDAQAWLATNPPEPPARGLWGNLVRAAEQSTSAPPH